MEHKPVEISDFLELKYVSDPRFSPDGKMISFVLTQILIDTNQYWSDLWIFDRETKKLKQLTCNGQVKDYFWDADGGLVFWVRKAEHTTLYRVHPRTDGEQELFSVPLTVNKVRPLKDRLYALTSYSDRQEASGRYHILEESPYCSNGQGIISGRRNGLYIYDADSRKMKKLTDENTDTENFVYRAGTLIYQATSWENYRPYLYSPAFYAYDLETNDVRQLTNVGRINSFALCFWKDDELLFSGIENSPGKSMGQNSDFYTLDLKSGDIRRLADIDMKIGYSGTGSDAKYGSGQGIVLGSDGVYFLAPVMDGTCINRMTFDKTVTQNVTEESGFAGSIEGLDIYENSLAYVKMERNRVAELYLDGHQITNFNEDYFKNKSVSEPELLVYTAKDGTALHGFCMKPRGYIPGKRYPGILHIHGGPKTVFGDVFHHEMQFWASNGFFVFYCNPRGSDGRGRDFADIRGRWGTIDYTDIMDFTDETLKQYPDIDPTRLGVCGGSYGGFMTNWIIGHTNRFAAACSQRSFANMINFEYLSDIGLSNIRSEHMGSAEENPMALWDESPLKYAPNCNTPTLFIHSDQDYRCPLPDALAMFNCLKRAGCPARLCLFHGENHELSRSGRPDNRITRLNEILTWFQTYLN